MVTLLLGESDVRWYVFGVFAAFFLISFRKLDFSWLVSQKKIIALWLGFFGFLGISFVFSHHIPLSLSSLAEYSFSFLVFVWSLSFPLSDLQRKYLSFLFVLVATILSGLSVFFFFHQPLGSALPGMNLLYATYGHNHLAAFLLLILPLAWYEILQAKEDRSRPYFLFTLVCFLIITSAFITSFGRTAIFLGGIELGILWFATRKKREKHGALRFFLPTLGILFALVLSAKLFLSFQTLSPDNPSCPVPIRLRDKLCKPFQRELRPLYLEQAIKAVSEFPIVGYGPGTFGLISKKYQQLPYATTSYAHNHFLHVTAEMGLFAGVVFAWLIMYLYKQAYRAVFRNPNREESFSLQKALFLGATASLVNALFDFDWGYVGIFSLTLFFLALLIRPSSETLTRASERIRWLKGSIKLPALFLILTSILFLIIEILIVTKNTPAAFQMFPFFSKHMTVFGKEGGGLDASQSGRFRHIYRFDPSAPSFLKPRIEDVDDVALRSRLFELHPWALLDSKDITGYIERGQYQEADRGLSALVERLDEAERRFGYEIGFQKKFALVEKRLDIADYFLVNGQPEKTAEYYLWAQKTEPWIFTHRQPPITQLTPAEDLDAFLLAVNKGDLALWGEQQPLFLQWHIWALLAATEKGEGEKSAYWFSFTAGQFPHTAQYLWASVSEVFEKQFMEAVRLQNTARASEILSQWGAIFEIYNAVVLDRTPGARQWEARYETLREAGI